MSTSPQDIRNYLLSSRPSLGLTRRSVNRLPVPQPARLPFDSSLQVVSGRCWIFGYINELQLRIQEERNETITLSRDWVFVHHLYAQSLLLLNREPTVVTQAYLSIHQDSFYAQFAAIIDIYGLVPYSLFPNQAIGIHAHNLVNLLNALIVTLRHQIHINSIALSEAQRAIHDLIFAHFELPRQVHWGGHVFSPIEFAEHLGFRNLSQQYIVLHNLMNLPQGRYTVNENNVALSLGIREAISYNIPTHFQQIYNRLFDERVPFIIGQSSFVNRYVDRYYGESTNLCLEDLMTPEGIPTQEYLEISQEAMASGRISLSHKICRWSSPEEVDTGYFTVIDSSHKYHTCMWVSREGLFADTYEMIIRRSIFNNIFPELISLIDTFNSETLNILPPQFEVAYGFN